MAGLSFPERYGPWAVVAGASEGLGAEFSRQLSARGLSVVLVARRAGPLHALAATLPTDSKVVVVDLGAPPGPQEVLDAVAGLDVGLLVASAAVSLTAPFLELDVADLRRTVAVNVTAPLELAHGIGRRLAGRGHGGMVIMSSVAGLTGAPFVATYAGSRAFLLTWGESLWAELRPRGVDVVTVAAGPTRTPTYTAVGPAGFPPMMEPEVVVRTALETLGRRPRATPGWFTKATTSLMQFLPRSTALSLVAATTRKYKPRLH